MFWMNLDHRMMKSVAGWAGIVFAFFAAFFWFLASIEFKVAGKELRDAAEWRAGDGPGALKPPLDGAGGPVRDLSGTLRSQSRWNAVASLSAALSAVCFAIEKLA